MRRRGSASVAANPTLIGAATVLVVVVAVFLAYNANQGLPFVPSYQLRAEVPNAANLVAGNDVRIGGARVGVLEDLEPRQRNGRTSAVLTLKLETVVKPLRSDTTVIVRPRSALGLKYVQLTPGRKGRELDDGATLPLSNATPEPVELDQFLNTFDAPTRRAQQENLTEFAAALAGRGADLNVAIQQFDPLLRNLEPVARNLADPRTGLGGFVRALNRTARIVAPAAETQGELFRNLDGTFGPLSDVTSDIRDTISEGPATLETANASLRTQRPFLRNSAALFAELRPGARAIGPAAPALADAFAEGQPVLRRSVELNENLAGALRALGEFSGDPLVPQAVRGLRDTARTLNPTLDFLAPVQTTCNYASLWFRNVSSVLSDGDSNGTWQRFIIILAGEDQDAGPVPNNESQPSSGPATGGGAPGPLGGPINYLHNNPYPYTASPGQPQECEAGTESFEPGVSVIGNDPGSAGIATEKTVRDPKIPFPRRLR